MMPPIGKRFMTFKGGRYAGCINCVFCGTQTLGTINKIQGYEFQDNIKGEKNTGIALSHPCTVGSTAAQRVSCRDAVDHWDSLLYINNYT